MQILHYQITPEGTIGERIEFEAKKEEKLTAVPGAALAGLFNDDDDEDWGGDAPDMSAEFERLGHLKEEQEALEKSLTADFTELPDGTMTLLRWPRFRRPAIVPEKVEGKDVTSISATAFASTHLPEERFAEMYTSPISYSVFCMRMGRFLEAESVDEGGPTIVILPDTINHIGPFAFWRCDYIKEIVLPDGIEEIPVGTFGDCSGLEKVKLPRMLKKIGYMPRPTDQMMPDIGAFAGCHSLKELTIPEHLSELGSYTFNSAGLVELTCLDEGKESWSRKISVANNAFDHTAALLWLNKAGTDGKIYCRLGLPAARDKILAGDKKFGGILRVPVDFFTESANFFDALAQSAFRLDFSARMALARLAFDAGLSEKDRRWYQELLVQYYDKAPQFMPCKADRAYVELFQSLKDQEGLTATDMSDLLRTAGLLGLPADLISSMMEVRTERFETVTGFEDLDL